MAVAAGSRSRKTCSAQETRAPGHHTAPGMRSSAKKASGATSQRTAKKSLTARQNASGSATDQRQAVS